jgi:hypothetical protein
MVEGNCHMDMDTPLPSSIAPEVALRLGYYVYLYTDPRSGKPFYVGKGQGKRVLSHLSAEGESRKVNLLRELKEHGLVPQIDILAHALPNEEVALRIEASVIDLLGLDRLSNEVRGWRSIQLGRMSLKVYYAATTVSINDPVILIRINKLYRHGMSALELYEATRGVWKLGKRRRGAKFAFAVFEGVVREVYEIHSWHNAGTNHYASRPKKDVTIPGRWEFMGKIASNEIRDKYVDHSVKEYLPAKAQNPIVYVNI